MPANMNTNLNAKQNLEASRTWSELLPRQKKNVYEFVADVLTISRDEAKKLCEENRNDSAYIGNAISDGFKHAADDIISRKWRSRFSGAIPLESWEKYDAKSDLYQLPIDLFCDMSAYTDEKLGDDIKSLSEHIYIHSVIHKRLHNGIPREFQEKYKGLINWLDSSCFKSHRDNPFLETGSIYRYILSCEILFRKHSQLEEMKHARGRTNKKITELILNSRNILGGYLLHPELERLERIMVKERDRFFKKIRVKQILDLNKYVDEANAEAENRQPISSKKANSLKRPEDADIPGGALLARILCEMTVNRCILEHNSVINILEEIKCISIQFFEWYTNCFCDELMTKDDVLTEESKRLFLERLFGKNSRYAEVNPEKAMKEDLINCILRVGNELVRDRHLGLRDNTDEEDLYNAAKLLMLVACYYSEEKVKSDRHGKSTIRILPGKTTGNLDKWVPSAEGRFLMLEMTDIFRYHLCTNNFSSESISISIDKKKRKIVQIQNLLFFSFKNKDLDFHLLHEKKWLSYVALFSASLDSATKKLLDEDDIVSQICIAIERNLEKKANRLINYYNTIDRR